MATRKRKGPRHPGVVLLKPEPAKRMGWRARFADPDTGKTVKQALDPALTTIEAREQWAVRKSREVAQRRLELAGGAPRATGTALGDALDRYFADHEQLREKTIKAYRGPIDKLKAWAKEARVDSADDLTRAHLLTFRAELIKEPKRAPVAPKRDGSGKTVRAKKGTMRATEKPRSAHSVNRELRALRTVLGYLRDLDLFPKLPHDDLRRALKRLPAVVERAEYLKPGELQELLASALRHDAEAMVTQDDEREMRRAARERGISRKALAALGPPTRTTPRYEPVAQFVAFVLLTGMRMGEAIDLDWSQVDLDALDHDGKKVGEIHLLGSATKTHKPRTVALEVSPALRRLLSAMHLAGGGEGRVFALARGEAEAAGKRLKSEYGAPKGFGWQTLRSTCATYLTNAPGIFGAASAYRSAKQLGHSVQVAERHYTDVLRGIPRDARTLEAAMQIEAQVGQVIDGVSGAQRPRVLEVAR